MNYKWFSPNTQKQVSRAKRAEWLGFIFEDGFGTYLKMMKSGSRPQRIAAWHVRLFIQHPSLRWYVDLFFRYYFRLVDLTAKAPAGQLCVPVSSQAK